MVPPSGLQQDMGTVKEHAEKCLMKCADDNITRIPQVMARFKQSLGSKMW